MSREEPSDDRPTTARVVWSFLGGLAGTFALMFVGWSLGALFFDSDAAGPVSAIIAGSVPIVLGTSNGSRPVVAGGITAFALVLVVVGGCFMLLSGSFR